MSPSRNLASELVSIITGMRTSLLVLVALATVPASADRAVDVYALDPPIEPAEYTTWLASQSRAVKKAIAKHCAKGYEWETVCNGIGPFRIEEEPPPRGEIQERAAWEASLTPDQAAYVARMCAGPRHLTSRLCGYSLPAPPPDPRFYPAWYAGLTRNERGMVDEHCAEMIVGTDEWCDGIGPLHIPSPPDHEAAQPLWDDWYRGLNKAQRAYYKRYCEGPNAGVSELCGGTPLVVVFDGTPVEYSRSRDGSRFAFGSAALRTDWPTARTPWIARDLDGDGMISDGRELFGSGTQLAGRRAADGFEALASLDDNHDGVIDASDPSFADLVLWSDRDGDRRGTTDELEPLAHTIAWISLAYSAGGPCDGRGNCERLRASAGMHGATRSIEVVDVQLLVQPPAR